MAPTIAIRWAPAAAGAIFLVFATFPQAAKAWGAEGHRIVAHLAYERLTPRATAQVDRLIAESGVGNTPKCPVASLEDASTWPDCVRPMRGRFEYLAVDHYEDVPVCGATPKASYCPDGKCLTEETRRAIAILKDRNQPTAARVQALEEVTHFIGDLHQPLHVADSGDRGGNSVHVEVDGHATNLHHVWDVEVLENAVGQSETLAASELRAAVVKNARVWSGGDLNSWLDESHQLAVVYVYPKLAQPPACGQVAPSQTISQAYLDGAAPIVREQLGRAVVRLAKTLNDALN